MGKLWRYNISVVYYYRFIGWKKFSQISFCIFVESIEYKLTVFQTLPQVKINIRALNFLPETDYVNIKALDYDSVTQCH